ncbi:hypothetical protein ACEUAG_05855 [Aeromonas hydrophila]|uniref:hypothetical protein n=1 Tax=Aeromonas hydrophila TaxID=644 RepID=UPI0038CF945E
MGNTVSPLYLDWSFWAVVVAVLAIILSQIPPILSLFKGAKLEIEPYSKIAITHKVGNPNLQLHLIINNVGGREIRVKDIHVDIELDGTKIGTLPAQNYLQSQSDKNTLLFTTFSIKPGEEWAHIINFLNYFNREDENKFRTLEKEMLSDLHAKQKALDNAPKELIEIESKLVQPFHAFFDSKFIWKAGEYNINVIVTTNITKANLNKQYRFTIFESHVSQLKAITEYFKYGGGISWDPNIQTNIIVDIKGA